jgi:hypothetical protein
LKYSAIPTITHDLPRPTARTTSPNLLFSNLDFSRSML